MFDSGARKSTLAVVSPKTRGAWLVALATLIAGCSSNPDASPADAGSPFAADAAQRPQGDGASSGGSQTDGTTLAPDEGATTNPSPGGDDGGSLPDAVAGEASAQPPPRTLDAGGADGRGPVIAAPNPFGCKFGWGRDNSGSVTANAYLQFLSYWVGSEVKADGSITSCSACGWLSGQLASTNVIPAFYAYFIGFYGHANGLADGNQTPNGPNLTTGGGALIKANRSKVVQMYAWYAQQTAKAWPNKPLVWLLEGDFVQYSASSQSSPLTYAELGQLAADITTAIKTSMPKAIVAIDHSTWSSNDVTNRYWAAMDAANYDLVWTTGVGNNNGFFDAKETSTTYNAATATYAYLRDMTGRKILVDESAGLSQASDTWSNQPAATINVRIAEGVIAANVTGAPSNYQANVTALQAQLAPTCP